jgi:hypothetical protein
MREKAGSLSQSIGFLSIQARSQGWFSNGWTSGRSFLSPALHSAMWRASVASIPKLKPKPALPSAFNTRHTSTSSPEVMRIECT